MKSKKPVKRFLSMTCSAALSLTLLAGAGVMSASAAGVDEPPAAPTESDSVKLLLGKKGDKDTYQPIDSGKVNQTSQDLFWEHFAPGVTDGNDAPAQDFTGWDYLEFDFYMSPLDGMPTGPEDDIRLRLSNATEANEADKDTTTMIYTFYAQVNQPGRSPGRAVLPGRASAPGGKAEGIHI